MLTFVPCKNYSAKTWGNCLNLRSYLDPLQSQQMVCPAKIWCVHCTSHNYKPQQEFLALPLSSAGTESAGRGTESWSTLSGRCDFQSPPLVVPLPNLRFLFGIILLAVTLSANEVSSSCRGEGGPTKGSEQ